MLSLGPCRRALSVTASNTAWAKTLWIGLDLTPGPTPTSAIPTRPGPGLLPLTPPTCHPQRRRELRRLISSTASLPRITTLPSRHTSRRARENEQRRVGDQLTTRIKSTERD